MANRVLSVVIIVHSEFRQAGFANINFHPHVVTGNIDQPSREDIQTIGPDGPFVGEPCKSISLRKIGHFDGNKDDPFISFGMNDGRWKTWDISDEFDHGFARLRVNWAATRWYRRDNDKPPEILEISYIIIGETG